MEKGYIYRKRQRQNHRRIRTRGKSNLRRQERGGMPICKVDEI